MNKIKGHTKLEDPKPSSPDITSSYILCLVRYRGNINILTWKVYDGYFVNDELERIYMQDVDRWWYYDDIKHFLD